LKPLFGYFIWLISLRRIVSLELKPRLNIKNNLTGQADKRRLQKLQFFQGFVTNKHFNCQVRIKMKKEELD